ncbi:hypothetical protein WUBG_07570 [Wuchereria bancrofti]|uniref:Phosphatidylinositol-glycan biosynthesis class W protein n=1 Tax=Wuchereria bancrofti TaxID=6293 RepID=J9EGC7_WUCBA|nr:hypothetical protein WUBG_07570 [Wuchereria bancrofti]
MRNGTTQTEVLLFQTVGPMSIILRNTAVPGMLCIFPCTLRIGSWLTFVLDLLLIVFPVVLTLTLFSDHILLLLLAQTITLLTFVVVLICDQCFMKRRKRTYCDLFHQINDDHYSPTKFVTYMRLYGFLATAGAILSVDFDVFPRRFAKTSIFGRSVMDLGTATFVYCFAVVDVFRHYPGRVLLFEAVIKCCVNNARHSTNIFASFHQLSISDQRIWYILEFLYYPRIVAVLSGLFGSTLPFIVGDNHCFYVPIFSNETKFTANFLFTATSHQEYCDPNMNCSVTERRKRIKVWFYRSFQLLLLTVVIFLAQEFAIKLVGPPSRRIANVPYILEMMKLNKKANTAENGRMEMHSETKIVLGDDENPLEVLKPFLVDSINEQGLLFFLLANILTGLVNKSINTSSLGCKIPKLDELTSATETNL